MKQLRYKAEIVVGLLMVSGSGFIASLLVGIANDGAWRTCVEVDMVQGMIQTVMKGSSHDQA